MKLLILLSLTYSFFAITSATETSENTETLETVERPHYDPERAREYFDKFLEKYSKDYDLSRNGEEREKRFNIFKENLNAINQLNSYNETVFEVNEYADLSTEESSAMFNNTGIEDDEDEDRKPKCPIVTDSGLTGISVPATLDYRTKNVVTSVKKQGKCNSCWAFSSVGTIEGAYAIKHRNLLSFSPKQLLDCLQCSTPCTGPGSSMRKALAELWGGGVMLDSDYPYFPEKSRCTYNTQKAKAKINGCTNFVLTNEEKYKDVLVKYGPVALGIDASKILSYKGGVITAQMCPPARVNHAVLLVGYGSDGNKNYWLIKDSRGTEYGERGYIRLERGHNVCGILSKNAVVASVE